MFLQIYGSQISLMDESKKRTTREWFDKEKKDKKVSMQSMREVIHFKLIFISSL